MDCNPNTDCERRLCAAQKACSCFFRSSPLPNPNNRQGNGGPFDSEELRMDETAALNPELRPERMHTGLEVGGIIKTCFF